MVSGHAGQGFSEGDYRSTALSRRLLERVMSSLPGIIDSGRERWLVQEVKRLGFRKGLLGFLGMDQLASLTGYPLRKSTNEPLTRSPRSETLAALRVWGLGFWL